MVTPLNTQRLREFADCLAELHAVLPPDVLKTLRPPATTEAIDRVKRLLAPVALPADVKLLLQWHDGQEWNSTLSPDNNRRLLSAEEIAERIGFFSDPSEDFLKPWNPSWVPLLTNDSGDYLVYETAGENEGKLIQYWHDDLRRLIQHQDLTFWANELRCELLASQ
ncbi:MAG: hypothetical protein RLZZ618_2290 [Pseudomonadota bacterium]|jgi:cell wall assembly regulator SMI1